MTASSSKPPWRSVVDRVDHLVTPKADAFVRTNLFADALAAFTRLEVQIRRRAEKQTTTLLHLYNLPTAGDVRRIRAQLATVEARLRDMTEHLEDRDRQSDRAAEGT